ncbi:MAG: M67 family metallopeptidase [Bacillota bacterium]
MIIKLSTQDYDTIVSHAQAEFPQEACGLVAGVTSKREDEIEVKEVYQMTNTDQSAEHFSMKPEEQFEVVKEVRDQDYELIGNYHSHPYTPARPSAEDKRLAYDQSLIYFILSLEQGDEVLKAFEIKEQSKVSELEIELVERSE